jgi:uncharacterized damage-inducible protein DinB
MNERINRDGLLALYDYNIHANNTVLDAVTHLSDEEFKRESGASHGSVFQLLRHIVGGEDYLFALCQPKSVPEEVELNTAADFRAYHERVSARNRTFLAELQDSDLDRAVTMTLAGQPYQFAMWQILTQSLYHGIHHRGELSILLTQLGHPLPDMDIIIHFMK